MASQKHWQDETETDSIDIENTEDEDLITQEEAEAIFRFECKEWIRLNQKELLNSPFATAYKKPWMRKSETWATQNAEKNQREEKEKVNKMGGKEK